jgi:hypothetical protein
LIFMSPLVRFGRRIRIIGFRHGAFKNFHPHPLGNASEATP